jgi:hypothetical protein
VLLLVSEQLLDLRRRGCEQPLQRGALTHEKVALLHEKPQLCIQLLFVGISIVLPQQLNHLLSLTGNARASALHATQNAGLVRHCHTQIRRQIGSFRHLR